jgi:uncharacterized repeat protein (TIGR01451 family)
MLEQLSIALPDTLTFNFINPGDDNSGTGVTTTVGGGQRSYFDLQITNTLLAGNYDGYCIDTDRGIGTSGTWTAKVFSSYESLPSTLTGTGNIEKPENLDLLNWIINQNFIGKTASDNAGTFTYGDVQRAIWALIDDVNGTSRLGSWSQAKADQIIALAQANGEGFVPTYDYTNYFGQQIIGKMGVILIPDRTNDGIIPDNIQFIIAEVQLSKLGDRVWLDNDANGIQDNDENGINNITVNLLDKDGNFIATTTTDANGEYSFTVVAGEYKVQFVQPNGYQPSPVDAEGDDTKDSEGLISNIITITPGQNNPTIDSGFYQTASLGDFVFEDKNANGIQEAGELGISGVTVKLLDGNGNAVLDGNGNPITTTTDGNGGYSFTDLIPGSYSVMFVAPNGYMLSPSNQGNDDGLDSDGDSNGMTQSVTLTSGELNGTLDAGLFQKASLGDFVFEDKNANGIQEAGELGVSGVQVTLTGGGADGIIGTGGDDTTTTTTTDGNGIYSFISLNPAEEYQVAFSNLPVGFQFTQADIGSDASDSDANINTGKTQIVTLTSGENNLTLDAGIYQPPGDLSITKTDGLTTVIPGQQITYTIVVQNNGTITASNALVSDIMPSNLTNISWTSVATGGATDNQTSGTGNINDYVNLLGGSSITYTVVGTVSASTTTLGSAVEFDFAGNSALDGTDGNTRTFTKNGISVTTRAFSRVDGTNGAWARGFLGSYGGGLGVTDSGESTSAHRVDNVGGRDNYVVFQFSESIVLDQAYLQYVVNDSDISVWIGNFNSSLSSLSDSTLSSFGFAEINDTTSSNDRWANLNSGNYVGNTIVIAASTADLTPEDQFKIRYLDVNKVVQSTSSLTNTATVTAPNGFTDINLTNNTATDIDTISNTPVLPSAPGVRTPGFWQNTEWQKFWDGIQGNEPSQKTESNFPDSDLLFAPYNNSAQSGKVLDSVSGQYQVGLLIGDFNRNGKTDTGEDTLFYTRAQALQIVDASQHPNEDKRYDLGRSLVAGWLNYLAGNPIDTANTTDKDARYYIKEGINWLQAITPDENGDKKGDGAINQLTGSGVSSPTVNYWNQGISSASSLPSPYNTNTNVLYPLDAGGVINTNLDNYNNGLGLADNVYSGGNV